MKILYIHQYFNTPQQAGGTRSYWICQELIKNGHEVTMLTSSSKIQDKIKRLTIDNIDVIYVNVPYSNYMGIVRRVYSFFQFMIKSTRIGFKQKDIDLVISTSTPLSVGFPALMLKLFKRTPYIFEVRDLWPEVPIQMQGIRNPITIKIAELFEKTIYKNAEHIVALSPGMLEGVVKTGIPTDKISMIPNMSKMDEFWPRKVDEELYKRLNIRPDSFKIIHFGSMGKANGLDYILDAAKMFTDEDNVDFIFLGNGSTKPHLQNRCVAEKINNIHFIGRVPMAQVSEIVNLCDASLVTFLNLPILATNSPNKLFDSLSAGKPIIVNSPGWTKDMVEEHNCGVFVDPESPVELVEKIRFLRDNPQISKIMGSNSRRLAENTYDKSILCGKYVKIIDSLLIKN